MATKKKPKKADHLGMLKKVVGKRAEAGMGSLKLKSTDKGVTSQREFTKSAYSSAVLENGKLVGKDPFKAKKKKKGG